MQGVAEAEVSMVLMALAAGIVAGALLVIVALRVRERFRPSGDPLGALFHDPALVERRIATVARAPAPAAPKPDSKVLRARIDHLDEVSDVWTRGTRAEAIEQVAQVMRAGVRKCDRIELAASENPAAPPEDGTFTIHAAGASDADAGVIARRLLSKLADMPVPGLGSPTGARISARIEVAPDEWEEVKLLPAPAPSQANAKSADAA